MAPIVCGWCTGRAGAARQELAAPVFCEHASASAGSAVHEPCSSKARVLQRMGAARHECCKA